jgi:hypothetical protein
VFEDTGQSHFAKADGHDRQLRVESSQSVADAGRRSLDGHYRSLDDEIAALKPLLRIEASVQGLV